MSRMPPTPTIPINTPMTRAENASGTSNANNPYFWLQLVLRWTTRDDTQAKGPSITAQPCTNCLAEAHGNRTHLRPLSRPLTGFEVQGPHQIASRLRNNYRKFEIRSPTGRLGASKSVFINCSRSFSNLLHHPKAPGRPNRGEKRKTGQTGGVLPVLSELILCPRVRIFSNRVRCVPHIRAGVPSRCAGKRPAPYPSWLSQHL